MGWGMTYEQQTPEPYDEATIIYDSSSQYDSSTTSYDPVVTGGCPQCGTYLYWI
jgi:hypothetical protein